MTSPTSGFSLLCKANQIDHYSGSVTGLSLYA